MRLLTVDHGTNFRIIGFSPERDRILFSKDEDGQRSLWSVGLDGSDPLLVVDGTMDGEWFVPSGASEAVTVDPSIEP